METPLCLPNCWKRPLCHVFGTVSVSVFNDVYRLQVLSIIFCNQELFMEVRMSGPNNKFYHPGACRLVDAYFRLNLAWWVKFFWFCRSYLQCLRLVLSSTHLFVRVVSCSWVCLVQPYSYGFRLIGHMRFGLYLFNTSIENVHFTLQLPSLFRHRDLALSGCALQRPSRRDGWDSSGDVILHESGCSNSRSLAVFSSTLWGSLLSNKSSS